ncbi:MAG: hypothetical protein Q9170_004865, partial [Blastenia crenularia]
MPSEAQYECKCDWLLVQLVKLMHQEHRVTCGNLTPDTLVLVGPRQELCLMDFCSSRALGQ